MADKIILNNGQEIEGATISEALWNNRLVFITVPGDDIVSGAVLFGNKQNTEKMEGYHSVFKDVYIGYTSLSSISYNSVSNAVEIWMTGDENAHHEREYTVPEVYAPKAMEEKENNENGPESNDSAGED